MRYDTQQDYRDRPRFDAPEESPDVDATAPVDAAPAEEPPVAAAPAEAVPTHAAPADDSAPLWPADEVDDIHQRWREVQWRFVDDPRAAADEAQALLAEIVDRFSATVTSRKRELDGWRDGDGADTEQMRMVVRRYRHLLDRLLEA
jgi:hypothetical protein